MYPPYRRPSLRTEPTVSVTGWLLIAIHILTILGIVWNQAARSGSLETRVAALEALTVRMVNAQEATAASIQNLALALKSTQVQIEERTRSNTQR